MWKERDKLKEEKNGEITEGKYEIMTERRKRAQIMAIFQHNIMYPQSLFIRVIINTFLSLLCGKVCQKRL